MALSAGTVFLNVQPDTSKFLTSLTAGLGPIQSRLASGFGSLNSVATTALAGIGAGFAVAGVAGIKAATDFEQSFTRIQALSNASAEDVANWREQVLQLAGTTAQAPKELADALFFLSSAGLKANQIMPALTVSAKASAVGLGDTADVANIVASALNAYADSGLTAKNVTDTLVAAVREGRAEPEAFATALGRILPIASAAGVSFDQVTGSLAGLSNIGLDVNEGVTAMRGLLQALVAPGSQAADALGQLGLTAQQLLTSIQNDGLLGALDLLDKRARANTDSQAEYIGVLREVVPNVRALTGALGLTGQNLENNQKVMDAVANSTGSLGDAFRTTEEGPAQQFAHVMTDLQVILIRFGEDLLPLVTAAASGLRSALVPLSDVFKFVGENAKTFLIVLGGMFIIPKIAGAIPALVLGIRSLAAGAAGATVSLESMITATQAWSIAISAAVAAGVAIVDLMKQLDQNAQTMESSILSGKVSLDEFRQILEKTNPEINDGGDGIVGLGDAINYAGRAWQQSKFRDAADEAEASLRKMYGTTLTSGSALQDWSNDLLHAGNSSLDLQTKLAQALNATYEFGTGLDDTTRKQVEAYIATGDLNGALRLVWGAITGTKARLDPLADAHERVAAAADKQREAELSLAGGLLGLLSDIDRLRGAQSDLDKLREHSKQGTEEYRDATAEVASAQLQVINSLKEMRDNLVANGTPLNEIKQRLFAMGRQAGLTKADVRGLLQDLDGYAKALRNIPHHVTTNIEAHWFQTGAVPRDLGGRVNPPATAEGGIVRHAQVRLVGERGPEAIVPLREWAARQTGGTQRLVGDLRMRDWRQGIATLDGEVAWEDLARSS